MTSYLSSLSTHYSSLKRLIPTSQSSESDQNVTDTADSHVSRVLRAYYTEKGRPFPPWLGPDPNAPPPVKPVTSYVAQTSHSSNQPGSASLRPPRSAGGGLGDLFDDRPPSTPQQEETTSLRSRRGLRSPGFRGTSTDLTAGRTMGQEQPQPTVRPLPSQRLGSYQNRGAGPSSNPISLPGNNSSSSLPKEQSAAERLRARLGGGSRSNSPATTPSPNTVYDNPMSSSRDRHNAYDGGDLGAGGFNPYANSSGNRNPYTSTSDDRYGGGGGGGRQKPYTSATSPWVTGDDSGFGYSGDLGSGAARKGPGLPSNPRRTRQ